MPKPEENKKKITASFENADPYMTYRPKGRTLNNNNNVKLGKGGKLPLARVTNKPVGALKAEEDARELFRHLDYPKVSKRVRRLMREQQLRQIKEHPDYAFRAIPDTTYVEKVPDSQGKGKTKPVGKLKADKYAQAMIRNLDMKKVKKKINAMMKDFQWEKMQPHPSYAVANIANTPYAKEWRARNMVKPKETMIPVPGTSYVQSVSSLKKRAENTLKDALASDSFGTNGKYNGPDKTAVGKAMLDLTVISLFDAEQAAIKSGKCGPDQRWKPVITPLMEKGKMSSVAGFLKQSPTAKKNLLSPDKKLIEAFAKDPSARGKMARSYMKEAALSYRKVKTAAQPVPVKPTRKLPAKDPLSLNK